MSSISFLKVLQISELIMHSEMIFLKINYEFSQHKKGNKYLVLFTLNLRLISLLKMRFSYMFSLKILGYGRNGLVLISIVTYALCASIYQNVYTKTIILYIYCIMYKHTVVSINTQIRIQKLLCIGVVNTLCCLLLRKHAKYYSNAFFCIFKHK